MKKKMYIDMALAKDNSNPILCARKHSGFSQEYVAEQIEVRRDTYANYENGVTPIPSNKLILLSKCLGVSADYLLGISTLTNRDITRRFGFNDDTISCFDEMIKTDKAKKWAQRLSNSFGMQLSTNLFVTVINGITSNHKHFWDLLGAFIFYALPTQFSVPVSRGSDYKMHVRTGDKEKDGTYILNLASSEKEPNDYTSIPVDATFLKAVAKQQLDDALAVSAKDYTNYMNKIHNINKQ